MFLEQIDDLYKIAEFMEDKELTESLEFIAKLIFKPDIPIQVATAEVVRMAAIAAKLKMKATYMAHVDKSSPAKKNIYFTAADQVSQVVASLKYLIKT